MLKLIIPILAAYTFFIPVSDWSIKKFFDEENDAGKFFSIHLPLLASFAIVEGVTLLLLWAR